MAYGMQAYDNVNRSKFVQDGGPRLAAMLCIGVIIVAFGGAWAIIAATS